MENQDNHPHWYNDGQMTTEEIKNLGARLKCTSGDLFDSLKNFTLNNLDDVKAQNIIKEQYYTIDPNQYTTSPNGSKVYGKIVHVDLEHRNRIIHQFWHRLCQLNKPLPNAVCMLLKAGVDCYYEAAAGQEGIEQRFKRNLEQEFTPQLLEAYTQALAQGERMAFILSHLKVTVGKTPSDLVKQHFSNKQNSN